MPPRKAASKALASKSAPAKLWAAKSSAPKATDTKPAASKVSTGRKAPLVCKPKTPELEDSDLPEDIKEEDEELENNSGSNMKETERKGSKEDEDREGKEGEGVEGMEGEDDKGEGCTIDAMDTDALEDPPANAPANNDIGKGLILDTQDVMDLANVIGDNNATCTLELQMTAKDAKLATVSVPEI